MTLRCYSIYVSMLYRWWNSIFLKCWLRGLYSRDHCESFDQKLITWDLKSRLNRSSSSNARENDRVHSLAFEFGPIASKHEIIIELNSYVDWFDQKLKNAFKNERSKIVRKFDDKSLISREKKLHFRNFSKFFHSNFTKTFSISTNSFVWRKQKIEKNQTMF